MNGTMTKLGRSLLLTVGAVPVLGALHSTGLSAQMPGGRSIDFDQERATFRAAILDQVRPVMDSWQGAWRGDAGPSVESFYTPDAVVAVPGCTVGGNRTIADFARGARRNVAGLSPSMLDFDASDDLAYVYGAWSGTPASGRLGAQGRLVTILRRSGEGWRIRSQLFVADSMSGGVFPEVEQTEPLPSLERRVAVGPRAAEPVSRERRERPDAGTSRRISAYRDLMSTMASLRSAWGADDADQVSSLMREDAWVQLPGAVNWAGRVTAADLGKVLPRFGTLNTAELDFDYGDTLAYMSGRYYVERESGPAESGAYVAVFQNLGSGWLIRSLVFF